MSDPDRKKSPAERLLQTVLASRFLTISALLHVLIVVLFGGKVLFDKVTEPPDFQAPPGDSFVQAGNDTPAPPPPAPAEQVPPPPSPTTAPPPPVSAPAAALDAITSLSTAPSAFSMPIPTVEAPSISKDLSASASAPAQSFGTGSLPALPGAMAGRGGAGRAGTGAKFGERSPAEAAVLKGLRWLQSKQQSDGFWPGNYKGAFSGLALLCFLGHGETPDTSREFGLVVSNAINALADYANAHECRFSFSTNFESQSAVYQHAICVYALSEAYTMTKNPKLVPIIQKAATYILDAQRAAGGWVYYYAKDTAYQDTSVTGWQIQALKAAHLTGIAGLEKIPAALDKAIAALDTTFNPKNGAYGYHAAGDHDYTLTGVGVLCKLFWQGRADKMVREGIKNIKSRDLDYSGPQANLYAWYYDTQACFQAQGDAWEWWNKRFQDMLVNKQNADGSWPMTGGKETGGFDKDDDGGLMYRTTLCILMLEVFYRYLPTNKEANSSLEGL